MRDSLVPVLVSALITGTGWYAVYAQRTGELEARVATLTERSKGRYEQIKAQEKRSEQFVVSLEKINTTLISIRIDLAEYSVTVRSVEDENIRTRRSLVELYKLAGGKG